jgi:hypothetical protein
VNNLIIWNIVVAAVLGGVCGALFHLLVGRGGFARAAIKTAGVILLTSATMPYVAPALHGFAAPVLPKSRVERAIAGFEARLAALPEWQERARGHSRKEVLELAHEVGLQGVARLDDESLAAASGMLAWFLEDLDVPTCGGFVKGTLSKERVAAVFLKRLDAADPQRLDAWMDVLYAAATAQLRGRQAVAPGDREVGVAVMLLLSRMPRTDAIILRQTLMDLKHADDEHACWAARSIYHYLPQLPEDARRDLTRAVFIS